MVAIVRHPHYVAKCIVQVYQGVNAADSGSCVTREHFREITFRDKRWSKCVDGILKLYHGMLFMSLLSAIDHFTQRLQSVL